MANLQIRGIPADLHERLRQFARENNCSMSEVALAAIARELDRRAWTQRLAQRPKVDLGVEAAVVLAEERSEHDTRE